MSTAAAKSPRAKNNMRHGLDANTLPLGSLPTGAGWIARYGYRLRRELEQAVLDARSQLTLMDAANISTAVRWERHSLLAGRWLKLHADEMTFDQRLAFSRDVATASQNRDKALRALGLDQSPKTIFSTLYTDRDDGSSKPECEHGDGTPCRHEGGEDASDIHDDELAKGAAPSDEPTNEAEMPAATLRTDGSGDSSGVCTNQAGLDGSRAPITSGDEAATGHAADDA